MQTVFSQQAPLSISKYAIYSIKDENGHKDFHTCLSKKALELGGYSSKDQHFTGINGGTSNVMTGFAKNAVLSSAGEIVDAVKSGAIRHFFLVAGCDGARSQAVTITPSL